MKDNYNVLIDNLDAFIRKYYANHLIKGVLYSIALLGSFFLIITLFESVAWFSTSVRSVLFYTYILAAVFILVKFIIIPLLKLYRIGSRITHEMAAEVVGRHFSEVKDTLLNTLQLHKLSEEHVENQELILASIQVKSARLISIPFKSAVDFSANKRYLLYALPPVIIICALLIASPGLLLDSGNRLINHTIAFEKPLPFRLIVDNDKMEAVQQEDFELSVSVSGDVLPSEVFIVVDGNEYRMQQPEKLRFTYTFKKIQKNQNFRLMASGNLSNEYLIKVLPKPIILNYDIELEFPDYIHRKNEVISNVSDINVPQGTTLNWNFYTRDAELVKFRLGNETRELTSGSSNTFTTIHKLLTAQQISVNSINRYMADKDSLVFFANVIPDTYPTISIEQYKDSVFDNKLYFRGIIRDDYGFKNLEFKLVRVNEDRRGAEMVLNIPVEKSVTEQDFFYYFDLLSLGLEPGQNVLYYFEVWDNDGVNGSKSTKSQEMTFRLPTLDEVNSMVDKHQDDLKNDFDKTIEDAKAIQREIKKINESLLNKKELNYQDKKQVQDLIERQKELQNKVEQMQLENKQMNSKESQMKQLNENIIEKQKQLEKLFEDIMSDEMKKMFDELQKMFDQLNKDKIKEVLEKMQMQSEDMEKDLDRNLELFKQLEFDKKLTESIDNLRKLAEEQEKLSKETSESDKKDKEQMEEKQGDINKGFEELKEELKSLEKLNRELDEPNQFEVPQEEQKATEQELNESMEEIKDSQMKKASEHQKKASEQMNKMGEMLFKMQQEMESEGNAEDAAALREILENLLTVSFDQESLMQRLKGIARSDPKYNAMVEEQKNIKDDLAMIEDSLLALSKRQAMIENFVNREIRDINTNTEMVMEALQNRSVAMAGSKQQYVMTSVNNLALLLSEALKNMEQNMSMMASGKSGKSNPKPGQGKSSMKSMRQMQEKLNQQMEQLRKGMQPKPDAKGQQGKSGGSQMSEQLARMAAQQEALRKMLQQYGDELKKSGDVNQQSIQKMLQEMEKTESDLVNKILNKQTMERQQEILTRLLESEKAEMKREQEERRESNEGKELPKEDPAKYFDSIGIPSREIELIHNIPPSFRSYYKNKTNSYFMQIPATK